MPKITSSLTSSIARFFSPEQYEYPTDLITAVDESLLAVLCGNENVKLYTPEDTCGSAMTLYFIAEIEEPDFPIEEEYFENGFGQKILQSRVSQPRMKFSFYCESYIRSLVYKIVSENKELLIDFYPTWTNRTIKNIAVEADEVDTTDGSKFFWMTLSFEVNTLEATGVISCCGESVFSEAPYIDECDDDGGDPEACSLMSISIGLVDDTATLTVTNPMPDLNNVWYFTPTGGSKAVLGSNITSATLPGYGTVEVGVNSGTCKKTASAVYSDECTGFTVSISNISGALTANVNAAHTPVDTYQWEYSEDGVIYTNLGTSNTQAATEGEGYYRVTVTKGDCETTSLLFVPASLICDIEGEITAEGNVLTWATESTEIITSYQWSKDIGEGFNAIPGETTEEVTADETAVYKITILFDNGCEIEYTKLHIMCADCATFDAEVTESGGTVTADVDGCSNPIYFWYVMNDGEKELLPETSNSFELGDDDIYLLVICCSGCEPKKYFIINGGTVVITQLDDTTETAWGG